MVTRPGSRRSSSRPSAITACRPSVNVHSGTSGTYTCTPRPPEVFGHPRSPCSSRTARSSCATRTESRKSVPGCGSRSIRSSSTWSVSERRTGHGWKVRQPRFAAHSTAAGSVGQISSADRPLGKAIRAVGSQSGRPFGARFW